MKKYVVLDYGQKVRSAEIPRSEVPATLCTFCGLFSSSVEDIKIRDVDTKEEMTLEEFNKGVR